MKYRHKVTGAVVEVMPGTMLPSVYEKVDLNPDKAKKTSDKSEAVAPAKKVAKSAKAAATKI